MMDFGYCLLPILRVTQRHLFHKTHISYFDGIHSVSTSGIIIYESLTQSFKAIQSAELQRPYGGLICTQYSHSDDSR
jgi:uncharacterized protein YrrD